MNTNQNNNKVSNNEIDLKDLFGALWRQKIIIIVTVLIITVLAGLYSIFVIKPVYSTNMNISVSIPTNYTSKYGVFNLPATTNQQYVNLVSNSRILNNTFKDMGYEEGKNLDEIRQSISASGGTEQNSVNLHITSGNSEGLSVLAQTFNKNYLEYVTATAVEDAADYFINDYTQKNETFKVELLANQELIKMNETLLDKTSKFIDDKEILNAVQKKVDGAEYFMVSDIINPVYVDIEKDIIDMQQRGYSLNYTVALYEKYLDELNSIKKDIANYYNSGDFSAVQSSMKNITAYDLSMQADPSVLIQKVSPSIKKNVVIAAVFGIMLGALIAFIREFWFKKA